MTARKSVLGGRIWNIVRTTRGGLRSYCLAVARFITIHIIGRKTIRHITMSNDHHDHRGNAPQERHGPSGDIDMPLLMKEIERERRTVRILEAELSLLEQKHGRKRKRQRRLMMGETEEEPKQREIEETNVLLETLDALQSVVSSYNNTNNNNAPSDILERKWHDDPIAFRLMSCWSGICFTQVTPSVDPSPDNASSSSSSCKSYELCGLVTATDDDPTELTTRTPEKHDPRERFRFRVVATISFLSSNIGTKGSTSRSSATTTTAQITQIQATVTGPTPTVHNDDYHDYCEVVMGPTIPVDEMDDLCRRTHTNLPQFFRQLVTFSEFHFRRSKALTRLCSQYNTLELKSAHKCSITLGTHPDGNCDEERFVLDLSWRWTFSDFGRGHETLHIEHCTVPNISTGEEVDSWMTQVMDPQGLQDLISCSGGCESAIELMLQACVESS
eukprot:scaffold114677_cov64-Attheya_sp.AAC.4